MIPSMYRVIKKAQQKEVNMVLEQIREEIKQNIGDNPYKNDGIYCSLHVIDKYTKGKQK